MTPIYIPVAVLLVAGFLTPFIGIKLKLFRRVLVTTALLFSFFFWISLMPTVLSGETITYNMNGWPPPFGITLSVDSLSIALLVIVSGLSLIISLLVEKFVTERRSEFYSLFLLFTVGMTGILITGDLFNLFVFTELMMIASYALSVFHRDGKGVEAGIKYVLVGTFAGLILLLGIALLYGMTGTLNMADLVMKTPFRESMIPLGLILTSYLVKVGSVPFHFWKPDVTEGAPLPVAAMIVSVSTLTGVYVLVRMLFLFGLMGVNQLLLVLGLLSMVVGAFMALSQEDLRRMLAYSSVSQMGYVLFAFGLGFPGFTGGLFHLINNALLKMVLFLILGSVISRCGGIKPVNMPVTGACFLTASLGIAGIPPLNGFASKLLIYEAGFQAGLVLPTLVAILVSVVTLAYYLKAFGKLFSGSEKKIKEDMNFLVPILVLTAFCVIMGLLPWVVIRTLQPVAESLLGSAGYYCSVFGC